MSDKITLNSIFSPSSVTTAASTINANNATIVTAFDNTLSRDGTTPNQMENNIDMNGNQILNLPAPVASDSPARLVDVISNPTLVLTIPPVGTSGATVPLLNTNVTFSGNNILSGNNTFSGTNTFSGGNTFSTSPTFSAALTIPGGTFTSGITGTSASFSGSVSTGALTASTTTISNSATVNGTSPNSAEIILTVFDSGMTAGNGNLIALGRDNSSNDRGSLAFYYAGLNSPNNHLWFGLWGTDHILNLDGNGYVGIGTGTSALTNQFQVYNNFMTGPNGFGYGVLGQGTGGTVTQSTNKSTGVTLNTPTGQITMNNATMTTGASVQFTLTNSCIAANDILVLQHSSAGTFGAYQITGQCVAGSATINVHSSSGGSLSEAIVLSYAIIKGAAS